MVYPTSLTSIYQVMTVLAAASVASVLCFFAFPKPIQHVFKGTLLAEYQFAFKAVDANEYTNDSLRTIHVTWPLEMRFCTAENVSELPFKLTFLNKSTDTVFAVYSANKTDMIGEDVWPTMDDLMKRAPTAVKCSAITVDNAVPNSPAGAVIPGTAVLGVVIAVTILRTLVTALHAPILNLLDSTTYDLLGEDKSDQYGRSRLFGSLGFVVSSVVTGLCISSLSSGVSAKFRTPDYSPSLICAGVSLFIGTLLSVYPFNNGQTGKSTHFLKAMAHALRSKEMIVCLINAFLTGMLFSLYGEYVFLILTRHYGVPHFVLGILVCALVISEIPSFSISGYALNHLGSTFCVILAHILWAVSFFIYGYCTNYWYFLIAQGFSGVAFPFFYNALLTQAANVGRQCKIGDGNAISTMHGLVTAMMFGVTSAVGGLFWGVLLDHYSGRIIFYIAAAYISVLAVIVPVLSISVTKSTCCPRLSNIPPSVNDAVETML